MTRDIDPVVFAEALIHSDICHEYDPVKAREYYLRTRELKGRVAGGVNVEGRANNVAESVSSYFERPVSQQMTTVSLRNSTNDRVAGLKDKLKRVQELYKQLVAQAKARSGVDPKQQSSSGGADKAKEQKKLSPQERAEAAKKAKEYREKNGDSKSENEAEALQKKIAAVEERIKKLKEKLAEQKKKQPKAKAVFARGVSIQEYGR